jgi:hypothetical protein
VVDAFYLIIWATINWLLHRGFSYLHPSKLVVALYVVSQACFALSTLAVIVLHAVKDMKGNRSERHSGLTGVGRKFVDVGKQSSALLTYSTLLMGWALINWALEKGLTALEEASIITYLLHWAFQAVFALSTLFGILKGMYDEIATIYRRLFPAIET